MNLHQNRTLLEHLVGDRNVRIKNSQSTQFYESNIIEIDHLYEHIRIRIQKFNIKIDDGQEISYRRGEFGQNYQITKTEKIAYIKKAFDHFISSISYKNEKSNEESSQEEISCQNCRNYEQNLQKYEGDVRQHIRLEQQLKLYQEGLEETIEEQKKQLEKNKEKITHYKGLIEEYKQKENNFEHKINKLEEQLENFRNKSGQISENTRRLTRQSSQAKSFKVLKQNNNILPPTSALKKQLKKQARKSIQKKPLSNQKYRQQKSFGSMNSHGHEEGHKNLKKNYPLAQKLIMDKNKQQKRKHLQAKFNLR